MFIRQNQLSFVFLTTLFYKCKRVKHLSKLSIPYIEAVVKFCYVSFEYLTIAATKVTIKKIINGSPTKSDKIKAK